jgi:WD40 repeat protein
LLKTDEQKQKNRYAVSVNLNIGIAVMMQEPPSAIAQQWELGVKINQLAINRTSNLIAASLGDGRTLLLAATADASEPQLVPLHDGISLSLSACGEGFVSGGDDGCVMLVRPDVTTEQLAQQRGRWVDHVAATDAGDFVAYSYGKHVQLLRGDGAVHGELKTHQSSLGGLAFSPNGKRLAASHLDGVSLWWLASKTQQPVILPWKGAHQAVLWSPDNKILMTAMQENTLHGWRLSDMNEMRMQGYNGKIHALDWSPKGRWLITAGAAQAVGWPFFGGGPWGKSPQALGLDRGVLVRMVACHPQDELVAIGYEDGMIELSPLDGRAGLMLHPPIAETEHAVTGLVWNTAGDCLFAATESGYLMLFTLASVSAAARV